MGWRAGVIGYGLAGRVFHVPLLQAAGFDVTAVATRRVDEVARDLPDAACAEPEALIGRPDVDLVVIASPNDSHASLAAAAIEAGRHVVVDKPFTLSTAEADRLASLAARRDRRLAIFQNRRWDGDFLTLQALLRSGELGEPALFQSRFDRFRPNVRARWREGAGPGAGILWDLGPHLLDQALVLFGWPDWIMADVAAQRPGAESDDGFQILLGLGALRIQLGVTSYAAEPGPRFVLHGERGSYVKHGLDVQEDQLRSGKRPGQAGWGEEPPDRHGTLSVGTENALTRRRLPTLPGQYERFYHQMAESMDGRAAVPVTAGEGRDVVRLVELARRSHTEGRRIAATRSDEGA